MKFSTLKTKHTRIAVGAVAALSMLAATGCTPSSAGSTDTAATAKTSQLGISDSNYSLKKLIAAAKKEKPITVSDTTGKIIDQAKAFSKKYGVKATGVKIAGHDQVQIVTREAQAKAVKTDVLFMTDSENAVGSLIPKGYVTSWMPPDLKKDVPAKFQDPVMVTQEPVFFAYNTQVYGDKCPIKNVWDLTDKKWRGKLALPDPQLFDYAPYWWNQLATHHDDAMKSAYKSHYGKTLKTDEDSATAAWIKALAQNSPQLEKTDENAAAAVGAPGQAHPFVGLMSAAKFRDNKELGYKLGACAGLKPFVGLAYTKIGVIATGTESPNAAKLFVHYMLTKDGIAPQTEDGKISTNKTVPVPADEPSGIAKIWDQVMVFRSDSMKDDLTKSQDWLDFWVANK